MLGAFVGFGGIPLIQSIKSTYTPLVTLGPEENKSREVELDPENVACLLLQLLPAQQRCYGHCPKKVLCPCPRSALKQQLRGTLAAMQWRGDTALTFLKFSRRSTASLVFRVGACDRTFTLSSPPPPPPHPPSPSLISNLASVDVKQIDSLSPTRRDQEQGG